MSKKKISNEIKNNFKYTKDQKQIIYEIEKTIEEWNLCREYFENVDEPKLVDYAIYKEEAVKSRYIYLLLQARKMGIKFNNYQSYTRKISGD